MISAIIAALHITAFTIFDWEPQEVRCTYYLPTGHRTADGTVPYEGIIASNREHLGDMALLYTKDYEYIGMFECRDVGGHYKLRNGTAIDVFRDDMESALDWVHTYGDYVYVVWIPAEG